MKINKSKRQLAKLLIEAGVTQFPDGANWAAQDKSCNTAFFIGKPRRSSGGQSWLENLDTKWGQRTFDINNAEVYLPTLIPNWHQAMLSRDEFDQIVAETVVHGEPDADGWIEWNGGDIDIDDMQLVDYKMACTPDGKYRTSLSMNLFWDKVGEPQDIIAYRLHKPEQAKTEPVAEAKPTFEQLAADYRNKLDYANRKQDEAEKAKVESDAALSELEKAIAAIGFAITPIDAVAQDPELVITDWRDLMIGDIIEYVDGDIKNKIGMSGPIVEFAPDATDGMYVRLECDNGPNKGSLGWPRKFRFIRRPEK